MHSIHLLVLATLATTTLATVAPLTLSTVGTEIGSASAAKRIEIYGDYRKKFASPSVVLSIPCISL